MSIFDKFSFSYLEHKINISYTKRYLQYGNIPQGLFWKNSITQNHRFEIILNEICRYKNFQKYLICDIGCGYGKFIDFLEKKIDKVSLKYQGCDLNPILIKYCNKNYIKKNYKFYQKSLPTGFVDFSVMSGTFNLCVTKDISIWERYLISNLSNIWKQTKIMMVFNLLESDKRKIYKGLYYTNRNWIKEICSNKYGETKIISSPNLPNDITIVIKR